MDLSRVDLKLLLALEALVSLRSVTLAARQLRIQQPAMSAALARLRALFGDELLVRSGGAMQVTPRAAELAVAVGAALQLLRGALDAEVPFAPAESPRAFTLASSDYTSLVLLPGLVHAVSRTAPRVDLRVVGYDKADIAAMLRDRQVDVAVGVFPDVVAASLVRVALFVERFVGVVRPGHALLACRPRERLATFAAHSHVLVSLRRDTRGAVDAALEERGLSRRVALTLPHMLAVPPILRRTDLVAAIPSRVASRFEQEGLRIFELPLPVAPWRVEMLYPTYARRDAGAKWLRNEIRHAARAASAIDAIDKGNSRAR